MSQKNEEQIRLIVRGDDMGFSHSGNEALIKCFREGIERTIEVIVPSPWFPEAVKLLNENPGVDIGIHLAITSEWDNVKWRPLSDCPTLKDDDGYFFPFIWSNPSYPGKAIKDHTWAIADVEKEFRAQIELGLKHLPRVSHITGHMGCTEMTDEVRTVAKKLAKEYGIDIDLDAKQVQHVSYDGPHQTFSEKKLSFSKMLERLEAGKTYLFVDHPGINSPELQAISHKGYENVAEDRDGVTRLWTDKTILYIIGRRNIQLTDYRTLGN